MSRQQAIYEARGNTELPLTNEQTAGEKVSVFPARTPCSFGSIRMSTNATQPKVDSGCIARETVDNGRLDTAVTMLTGVGR